jgi:hypothetical protein
MSVACGGVRNALGLRNQPPAIHLAGAWAVAASGNYRGHPWVRYTLPADHGGICYALEIDGRDANDLAFAPGRGPAPGGSQQVKSASPVYDGYVPSCGLFPGEKMAPIQPLYDQRQATATEFGFLSGIVPKGSVVVARLDDGSEQEVMIARDAFTLFYGPGRTIVGLQALDAAGDTLARCTVSSRRAINGAMLLTANC